VSTLAHWLGEVREERPIDPGPLLSDYLQHLSASSIGMLNRCAEQFRQRYILGNKERPGEAIFVGSLLHETLAWNYQLKLESHVDQPLSDAVQYLQDVAVPKVLEESGGEEGVKWDSGLDAARGDAHRITGAYYYTVVPRVQPILVEQRFSLDIPGVEIPVIGYIDVEDENRVLDTKTGKQAVRKVKPSWQLQGRLYASARGKPTEFHSISRAKTPTIVTALESDQMLVPVPTLSQSATIARLVQGAANRIRWYLATYGPDQEWETTGAIPDFTRNMLPCDWCGYRSGCSAWN
jgi:PD-(D/E)XK nuclease superfamily